MGFYDKTGKLADTLMNLVSRIGVSGDKQFETTYGVASYTQAELDAAYRGSWLARKIIDIPPLDMTREWRLWQAEDDQIEALEAEEKRLGLIKKVRQVMTWARLYGGAALILGVDGQGDARDPLDPAKVKKGQLLFVHAVTRYRLSWSEIDQDPLSPFFNEPRMFQVSGSQTGSLDIHPSRVLRFIGAEIPDEQNYDGWGDPYWATLKDIITDTDLLPAAISSLVHESKVDVIHVPNLMDLLGTAEQESKLLRRFSLANTQKSLTNMLMLDGGVDGKSGEVWERKEMNFGGLTDILSLFLAVSAGAADIPATRLLGKSPDGMNSTGDSDIRNYYDMLSSRQELEMWPAIAPLDEIMMRSLWGDRPEEIFFETAPLWQMTPAEKSAISKQKAETTQIYVNSGLIPELALAAATQNQLIEDQVYPGLEAALDEFGSEPDEEEVEVELIPPLPEDVEEPEVVDSRHVHDKNQYRLDPTNTGSIRKAWKAGVSTALRQAEKRIKSLIKSSEAVGLDESQFKELLDKHLGGHWFMKHVVRAYRRGLDAGSTRLGVGSKPFSERDLQAINAGILKTQQDFSVVAEELSRQIATAVSNAVSVEEALSVTSERVKAIGIARGHAVAVVNTVAAHASASLNLFKANGVKHVGLDIEGRVSKARDAELLEFGTAGDNEVCPDCEDLEGQVYAVDEAFGIIPVHPHCRCAWIPLGNVGDASPRTLYIRRDVLNAEAIIGWARDQGFETTLPASGLHVTICYSRTSVDWMKVGEAWNSAPDGSMTIRPGGARLVERLGPQSAIVLLFNSSELAWRHEEIKRAGATSDYDDYQPHVTITYDGSIDISGIEPYRGEIVLGPEIFEEVKDNFQPQLQET